VATVSASESLPCGPFVRVTPASSLLLSEGRRVDEMARPTEKKRRIQARR